MSNTDQQISHFDEIAALVNSGDVKLDDYRAMFQASAGRPSKLSDSQLIAVIANTEDDMEAEAWVEAMLEAEKATGEPQPIAAESSAMIDLAKAFASNADAMAAVETVMVAKETTRRGPIVIMNFLRTVYGETLHTFPVPGSTEAVGNRPADKYSVKTKNAKGVTTSRTKSKLDDFADSLPFGKDTQDHLERIANQSGEYAPAKCGPKLLESSKTKYTQRQSGLRTLIKQSVGLDQQFEAVNLLAGCEAVFVMDTVIQDGKEVEVIANTTQPICVQHVTKRDKFQTMSVTSFLSLDVDAAKEAGGTYEALIGTIGKGATATADKPINPDYTTWSAAQFEAILAKVAHYLEDEDKAGAIYKRLKEKDAASFIRTLGDLYVDSLGNLFNHHAKVRYQHLVAADSVKAEQDAKAQKPAA
jgi:hypothetical protein